MRLKGCMNILRFDQHPDWLSFTLANPYNTPSKNQVGITQADGTLVSASWLAPGVLKLLPQEMLHKETWVLSAGIHGNETAPIEWLNQLLASWCNGDWVLKEPLLLIMGNLEAMIQQERFLETNMNRLFGLDTPKGSGYEIERAKTLRKILSEHYQQHPAHFVHYDLHTAIRGSKYERFAVCPLSPGKMSDTQRNFLETADIQAALHNTTLSGNTFSSFSAYQHGAEAGTLELGKVHPFGENNLSSLTSLTKSILKRFSGESIDITRTREKLLHFKIKGEVTRKTEAFKFYVTDEVDNFTAFNPYTLIAEDIDYEYRVGAQTEYILFPNPKVQLGHRAALMVKKMA